MALFEISFYSYTLGMSMQMNVILPQPKDKESSQTDIPVLYLLHGRGDDHSAWLRYTSIERYANQYNLAVIMPSTHLGFYTDMALGNRYWTFISEELPEICHSFFPQLSKRREDTFAAGLSMGGYGALKLGLRKPERFSAIASLSGSVDVYSRTLTFINTKNESYWTQIFGDVAQIAGSDNDLFAVASKLAMSDQPKPKVFMWCGTEDFLYEYNVAMKNHLSNLSFDLTYEESPGDHQWKYWDQMIKEVLAWLPISK